MEILCSLCSWLMRSVWFGVCWCWYSKSVFFNLQWFRPEKASAVGETGASCYRGRLLQGRFMQNYHIDGEIADSSCIRIHQGNH